MASWFAQSRPRCRELSGSYGNYSGVICLSQLWIVLRRYTDTCDQDVDINTSIIKYMTSIRLQNNLFVISILVYRIYLILCQNTNIGRNLFFSWHWHLKRHTAYHGNNVIRDASMEDSQPKYHNAVFVWVFFWVFLLFCFVIYLFSFIYLFEFWWVTEEYYPCRYYGWYSREPSGNSLHSS